MKSHLKIYIRICYDISYNAASRPTKIMLAKKCLSKWGIVCPINDCIFSNPYSSPQVWNFSMNVLLMCSKLSDFYVGIYIYFSIFSFFDHQKLAKFHTWKYAPRPLIFRCCADLQNKNKHTVGRMHISAEVIDNNRHRCYTALTFSRPGTQG